MLKAHAMTADERGTCVVTNFTDCYFTLLVATCCAVCAEPARVLRAGYSYLEALLRRGPAALLQVQ